LSQNREGLSERWATAETHAEGRPARDCTIVDGIGYRPPGLPVHHARARFVVLRSEGGSVVMSCDSSALALGAQQREGIPEALLED
jgi:hypothetical protein